MISSLTLYLKVATSLLFLTLLTPDAKAQQTSTFSLPGYTMQYMHNGTTWDHVRNITFTYNSAGLVTESLSTHPQTGQNISKSIITHDANGNQRSYISYSWQNMTWVMAGGGRDSLTYNVGNKIVRKLSTIFRNNTWENNMLEENTYDLSNNLTESTISTWDTTAWLAQHRYSYTYDANGVMTEKITYFYLNTPLAITQTDTYLTWHIPNLIPATYTTLVTGSLHPDRHTVTMGPNGGYTDVSEYFYIYSNSWGNSNRRTITKDLYGIETGSLNENFDLPSNSWIRDSESRNLHTYNSQGDLTETIRQTTDNYGPPNRPVKDRYKLVHSNFQYFSRALGTLESQKTELALNVYPNPATDKIEIALAENKPQILTATIMDITGKIWQTQSFKATENKKLNIENMPKGIYLLQLQTESGSTIKRIVKQ